jgi:hypothetical protein
MLVMPAGSAFLYIAPKPLAHELCQLRLDKSAMWVMEERRGVDAV